MQFLLLSLVDLRQLNKESKSCGLKQLSLETFFLQTQSDMLLIFTPEYPQCYLEN